MARIADLMAEGRTISFEFFPPKTDDAADKLEATVAELAPYEPSFISVTYGQLGSTRDRTRDLVVRFNDTYDFPAMAHLTCVGHDEAEIRSLLDSYRASGVENILALGGDPPADGSDPGGDFRHADELVDFVRREGPFSIGVAAHPEVHPRSPDRESDRRHLAAKLERADFGITQFFFDADDHLRMIDELAALGCERPVLPGVMLFISLAGVERMAAMNHAKVPVALVEALTRAEGDADEIRKIAVATATELSQRLLDAGVPGLHIYTLNRAGPAAELAANLGMPASP